MSAERTAPTMERPKKVSPEMAAAHAAKLAELKEAFDVKPESPKASEKRADKAREIIAAKAEPMPAPAPEIVSPMPTRPAFFNHHLNYRQTLGSVQRKLPELSRRFSTVIHAPAVEKTSEVLEATLARPSVLLGTTWTALLVGTSFYLVARHYGYALSGSELLFSFVVGALVGLTGEGLWRLIKRR